MCDIKIYRLTACDPQPMSRTIVFAIHSDHLPVNEFPGCHLVVEPVSVDEDGPEFEDALNVSFVHLIGPLKVRT